MDVDLLSQTIRIPYYANLETETLGLDSPEHCFYPVHYHQYPKFNYKFNSIGYRTTEPSQWTGKEMLVLGDSFTLGLGCDITDVYTTSLQQKLNYPVINISLNGASNDWIARKLKALLNFFDPPAVVIHYTFSHRRELDRDDWFDDERTLCEPSHSVKEDLDNWQKNYQSIVELKCPIIHSFITNWHPEPIDYANMIAPVQKIDLARDGFHYGPQTHLHLTNLLADELRQFL